MDLESKARGSESRLAAYVEAITSALGHADRAAPFQSYCAGLPLPGDRTRVEPMAARVQPGPAKYFLSTLPASISRRALVDIARLRWRDDQDVKQEPGLGHDEGRGWRGLHHHATLCMAAYGGLLSERGALSPAPSLAHSRAAHAASGPLAA